MRPKSGTAPKERRDSAEERWFEGLFALIPEVFFRYRFGAARGFEYLSPAIRTLTGFDAASFIKDPAFCLRVVAPEDRRVLRQIVRSRRGLACTLHVRDAQHRMLDLEIRTVPVVRAGEVVAVEGVARTRAAMGAGEEASASATPVPQRLTALLLEVHDLLHRHPEWRSEGAVSSERPLTLGGITLNPERMSVALDGRPAPLTTKEVMVLRYFLLRPNRIVTREQLLQEVWGYQYTGDARTVDVHVSRIRRKLPPLKEALVTLKHIGYRLDVEQAASERAS
jgi:DNA-binding winged helix-turn-helix (wHTH) protein